MKYQGLGSVVEVRLPSGGFAYGVVAEEEVLDHKGKRYFGDKIIMFAPILPERPSDIDLLLTQPIRMVTKIFPSMTRRRKPNDDFKVIAVVDRETIPRTDLRLRDYWGRRWHIRDKDRSVSHSFDSLPEKFAFINEVGCGDIIWFDDIYLKDRYPWSSGWLKNFPVDFDPYELEARMRQRIEQK